jgi:hypothetical protein
VVLAVHPPSNTPPASSVGRTTTILLTDDLVNIGLVSILNECQLLSLYRDLPPVYGDENKPVN